MFIISTFSTCFGHHYAHLQETKTCVTARGVLRWLCWMWLVAVVGSCVVGCEHCEDYCSQCSHPTTAPHNRYQPHPAIGYCSNSNLHSARTLQHSAPQPLPTTSSSRLLFDCRTVTFTVLAPYNTAPHNRYHPHPAVGSTVEQ